MSFHTLLCVYSFLRKAAVAAAKQAARRQVPALESGTCGRVPAPPRTPAAVGSALALDAARRRSVNAVTLLGRTGECETCSRGGERSDLTGWRRCSP